MMSHKLYHVIRELEAKKIWFTLSRHRDDSVMISCTLVGLRLEIDVFEDGHIEYSAFKGDEGVETSEKEMQKLIASFE